MDTYPAPTTSTDCGHPDGYQRAPSYLSTELLSATSQGSQIPWPGVWGGAFDLSEPYLETPPPSEFHFPITFPMIICRWLTGLNFWGLDFSNTIVKQAQISLLVFLHKIGQR